VVEGIDPIREELDREEEMIGKLSAAIGKKIARAAVPGIAEVAAEYVTGVLWNLFNSLKIDPLTSKQEEQIRKIVKDLLTVQLKEEEKPKSITPDKPTLITPIKPPSANR
jgi:hypothetical protein